MKLTELVPLTTDNFNATHPRDINDDGVIVGYSYVHSTPVLPVVPTGPYSQATLWENGVPFALTNSPNRSEARVINNRGEVLLVIYDHPTKDTNPTYYIWTDRTAPVNVATLVPDLISVLDLNNHGQLLGIAMSNGERRTFLFDLYDGSPYFLPTANVDGHVAQPYYAKVDNQGRVMGVVVRYTSQGTEEEVFWLAPSALVWQATGIRIASGIRPSFCKNGVILATVADGYGNSLASWYDPSALTPQVNIIPVLPIPNTTETTIGFDASAGQIVLSQRWDVPVLYKPNDGFLVNLTDYFGPPWTDPTPLVPRIPMGINSHGVVIGKADKNIGSPSYQTCGWALDLDTSAASDNPFSINRFYYAIATILFGVTGDGGGLVFPPGGPPIPIDPWGPKLSPERRDLLAGLALGRLAPLFSDPATRRLAENAEIAILERAVANLRDQHAAGSSADEVIAKTFSAFTGHPVPATTS